MKYFFITAFFLYSISSPAQKPMRPIEELINKDEPAWAFVKEWIDSAKNKVEVLPADSLKAKDALYKIQVTTRSPMGAIIYMTGGLLVDHGWIRILGSGSEKLTRSLPGWNEGKVGMIDGNAPAYLLIADDAIGGFFLLNGGGLGKDVGKIYYLSPDSLEYEPLDITYSEFLEFCFNSNLDEFYKGLRWRSWKTDVASLHGDKIISFFPYLWTKEGKDVNKASKKIIPVQEHYLLVLHFRKELGIE